VPDCIECDSEQQYDRRGGCGDQRLLPRPVMSSALAGSDVSAASTVPDSSQVLTDRSLDPTSTP
jgi:hypothetical protein